MAVVRPYYEFREVAKGLVQVNEVGQRVLAQQPGPSGEIGDLLLRLHHLAVKLEGAIGDLADDRPADAKEVWNLLPDVERELCRWAYEPPIYLGQSYEYIAEVTSMEPTLPKLSEPRVLLEKLNAARVELAALEPRSLGLESLATPQLSSLDAPGL